MKINELLGPEQDSDELFEMANLDKKYTGFDKIIYISTATGPHPGSARVKLYYKAGGSQPSTSISISDEPEVLADSLHPKKEDLDNAIKFVKLNKASLLKFWNQGTSMVQSEIDELFSNFIKI